MRRFLPLLVLPVLFLIALAARRGSPGVALENTAERYLELLSTGDFPEAWLMLSDSLGLLVSPDFIRGLGGRPVPGRVFLDGYDHRGTRMRALSGETSRMIWLEGDRVRGDADLDALLGQAPLFCRQAFLAGSPACPVSGRDYIFSDDSAVCPAGHLGRGMNLTPAACGLRRDSVAAVVHEFLNSGHPDPPDLESIFTLSGGALGNRGGWRCPDNAYSYYILRNDSVVCRHHGESTPVNP